MAEKIKTEVVIDGRNFTVVGESESEYIRQIAYYVDTKIRELSSKNDKLNNTMTATLAAFNIADEYYKTKQKYEELEEKSKDPMNKYDSVKEDLEDYRKEIEAEKEKVKELERVIYEYKEENEKLFNQVKTCKVSLNRKEDIIKDLEVELKELQDKNFQNHIELVEARKELREYISLLDDQTS